MNYIVHNDTINIMKFAEKLKAIKLRRRGYSYKKIRKTVKVSKSSLSRWLNEIDLTPKQREKLLIGREFSRYAGAKAKRRKKTEIIKMIVNRSREEFIHLVKNPLFLSGLMLYWAEGDKNQAERVKFTNSDETTIILMMSWFREICKVPEEKFRIALHIHNLHSKSDVKYYWSKLTGIPTQQFHKLWIKKSSLRQRRNILYNGTCAIVVNDKNLFRRITGWKLGLLDYFNITPRSSTDRTRDF